MILNKLSDTEYGVTLYDWITTHEDYIAGYIKRTPSPIGLELRSTLLPARRKIKV